MTVDEQASPARIERVAEPTPPPAGRPVRARRFRLPVWTPWLAAPVLVGALYAALPTPTDVRSHYQASAVALFAAPALAWLLTRRGALAHHTAGALAAALLPAWTMISLHGTGWFFAGPIGDQSFRLEYAARFASDLTHLTDYTYDVPAFYSPGFFWVVGAVSRVTGAPAWHAFKWVAIATMYVAAVIAFWMWRRTRGTRLSALLVTVTLIGLPSALLPWFGGQTLMTAGAYEPYNLVVALSIPAALTWFARPADAFSWRRALITGALLGIAAWLYLLYASVAVLGVLFVTATRWRSKARWLEVVVAGLVSIALVLPWLGRFLLDWWRAGRPLAVATTWVEPESFVRLVLPVASPWLLVAALGAVGMIVLRGRAHSWLLGCQAAAGTVLLLGVVQLLAGQAGRGVFFHRQVLILGITLLAAGTLTLAHIAPALRESVLARWPTFPVRRSAAAVLAVASLATLTTHADEWMTQRDLRTPAFDYAYPDGTFPELASAAARARATGQPSVDALASAVRTVMREAGRPADTPVLTDHAPLLSLTDLFGYQQWWELYANPLGQYTARQAYLQQLGEQSPGAIVQALRDDRAAPTVFVLQTNRAGRLTYTSQLWDPLTGTSPTWTVTFPGRLLDRPDFATRHVGNWTVAALRNDGS